MRTAPHICEGDSIGFEGDGQRVPITWPEDPDAPEALDHPDLPDECDVRRARQQTIARLIQWLTSDSRPAKSVGQRCIVVGYLLKPIGTQRDLARRLGVTEARASQLIKEVRADLSSGDR